MWAHSKLYVLEWRETLSCLLAEKYEPCRNPGAASTSVPGSEKAFYQAGETLTFSCQSGHELQGEATIYCIPGHPSQWNSTPPACRGKRCSPPHTGQRVVVSVDLPLLFSGFVASSAKYVDERRLDGRSSRGIMHFGASLFCTVSATQTNIFPF